MTDIDIDFADRSKTLEILNHIPAAIKDKDGFKKHNTGVYFQKIPNNPLTRTASFDYKEAEARGYFKIDFLNVSIYRDVTDEAHLNRLINTEPVWELLEQKDFTDLLFHLNGHEQIVQKMKPTNIEELAAVLALIRPAKRYLIGKDWPTVLSEVWTKPDNDDYYFKKSHSISYAMAIVVQMNLICEKVSYEYS